MERARKWVMVPAESETDKEECNQAQPSINENDLVIALRIAASGHINSKGVLLDLKKRPIAGCNIYKCLTDKSKAKQYNKYLEMKAHVLAPKKVLRSNKRKKSDSEWSEDDD